MLFLSRLTCTNVIRPHFLARRTFMLRALGDRILHLFEFPVRSKAGACVIQILTGDNDSAPDHIVYAMRKATAK